MINQKINSYAYQLGFVPNLDAWLTALNALINQQKMYKKQLNEVQKEEFLTQLDALFFLYNNGTYYEVDKDNRDKVNKIKTKLKKFFDTQQWDEEERDLLYQVYLHSF